MMDLAKRWRQEFDGNELEILTLRRNETGAGNNGLGG